jgi:cytochrome c553
MKPLHHPLSKKLSALAVAGLLLSTGAFAQKAAPVDGAIKAKVAMCIGCHGIIGYQASFPEVHKVPMISGQSAKYIAAALEAYRKGDRKHPTMKAIAGSLSDKDIADVSAYYEANGKELPASTAKATAPSAEIQALLTKGNCLSCHGEGLNKPIDGSYPKLAGQHADYLYVAMKAYQLTGNAQIGRANPIMAAQAKLFTHAELKTLANYAAALPGELKIVPQPKLHR